MMVRVKAYGQEQVIVWMLTSLVAAMQVTTARGLLDTLCHVAKYPESARAMLINGSFLRHPNAAEDIANATLRLIAEPKNPGDPRDRKHLLHFYWGKKPAHIR